MEGEAGSPVTAVSSPGRRAADSTPWLGFEKEVNAELATLSHQS
jgi:hypothetical protein